MSQVGAVLPLCPFPALHWWLAAQRPGAVWDGHEYFVKQSPRSRLKFAGARGEEWVSLSVAHFAGKQTMREVVISPHIPPRQIWGAIQTLYGRAPFFEHFAPELKPLVYRLEEEPLLMDFCIWTWTWVQQWTGWKVPAPAVAFVQTEELVAPFWDFRAKACLAGVGWEWTPYGQVFSDRTAFVPGCSVLDALMVWGPEVGTSLNAWIRPANPWTS